MKTIIIDGNNFDDYDGFANELSQQLGLANSVKNLNALDDILYGGVIGFDSMEHVQLIWRNSSKSKKDMGNDFYINWLLEEKMKLENNKNSPLTADESRELSGQYDKRINEVKNDNTLTFYQFLTEIIKDHSNIEFIES